MAGACSNDCIKVSLYVLIGIVMFFDIIRMIFAILYMAGVNIFTKNTDKNFAGAVTVLVIVLLVFIVIELLIQVLGLVALCTDNRCLCITYCIFEWLSVFSGIYSAVDNPYFSLGPLIHLAIAILMIIFLVNFDNGDSRGGRSRGASSRRSSSRRY